MRVDQDLATVRRDILAFVLRNPRAQDTLEGIVEWWLLEQRIERETARIRRAVEELVADGLLVEKAGGAGPPRYAVNPARLDEARRLAAREAAP